jgi:hypothetical protein
MGRAALLSAIVAETKKAPIASLRRGFARAHRPGWQKRGGIGLEVAYAIGLIKRSVLLLAHLRYQPIVAIYENHGLRDFI